MKLSPRMKQIIEGINITPKSSVETEKQVSDLIRWYTRIDQQCEKNHRWIVRPEYKARAIAKCKIKRYTELIERLDSKGKMKNKRIDNRKKINALKRKRSKEYQIFTKYDKLIQKNSRESKINKR